MDFVLMAMVLYLIGAATMLLPKAAEMVGHYIGMLCSIAASALITLITLAYMAYPIGGWLLRFSWGGYSLQADFWSAAFLIITGVAGVIISIYGIDYAKGYKGKGLGSLTGLWNLFLLSIVAVLISGDAFTFIVSWEVMALVSWLLVNQEKEKKETTAAAYQYMVMTHIGTAAILVAFYILCSSAGSFAFGDLAKNSGNVGWLGNIAFVAAFIGFALKSGLMPLHIWLPNAHPAAPSHVSALMSGVMLKVALYGFGRFVFQFIGMSIPWYGLLVMLVGLISAFLGVLYASMDKDIKRILAYSSVENMGIIFAVFGLGMFMTAMGNHIMSIIAFTAALVHAFSHSLMKGLMFMSAGAIMHGTGTKNIELMGGLAKKMPYTAFFALIGSMALSSLPLTSGLVGEWLVLQSFASFAQTASTPELRLLVIFAFIMLGLTGATALGCFVRMYGTAFLGRARTAVVDRAHEMPFFMVLGMGLEAALVVIMGVMPDYVVNMMEKVVGGFNIPPLATAMGIFWGGTGSYSIYSPGILLFVLMLFSLFMVAALCKSKCFIRKDVTWNCGTYPTERQQYSATGMSKPLRRAFELILRPRKQCIVENRAEGYFGKQMRYVLSIPDQFQEKLYQPFEHLLVRGSYMARRLQQGSVNLFIGYTMLAMIVVLIWGLM